jgi:2-hydroxychromene-2-carboxylate isomerase
MVELWFELASTYSYIAAERIEVAAAAAGQAIAWRPFLLGPVFAQLGWNDSPFNLQPVKGAYMWRDLERWSERLGLGFRRPTQFPRNSVRAARIALLGADERWGPTFVRAMFRANFERDLDIASTSVITGVLDELGLPRDLLDRAESADEKPKLRAQTQRAIELGIFGAPTFVVGRELFWGNDRLDEALAWALAEKA